VSAYHLVNAFDEGDFVHLDICLSATNAFPFMRKPTDAPVFGGPPGALTRWSFDMSSPGEQFQSREIGPPGDLPRLRDVDQGRPYTHFWMPTYNPHIGPPVPGGPVGVSFNSLLRVEVNTGRVDSMDLPPGMAINEPVHIPGSIPGHDGYLATVVDRELDEQHHESELWILDATHIAAPPLAKVRLPLPLHPQVHGWWVSAADLAASRS
jgi:carotenoid cleavage dioxygenase